MILKAEYVSATGCLLSLNKNGMLVASYRTNLSFTFIHVCLPSYFL